METETTLTSDVDLSQLISVTVDFKSLQVFLRSVTSRLSAVETGSQIHDKKLGDLFDAVDELKQRKTSLAQNRDKDAPELFQLQENLDALTARVNALASQRENIVPTKNADPAPEEVKQSVATERIATPVTTVPAELASRLAQLERELQDVRRESEQRDAELEGKIGSIRAAVNSSQRQAQAAPIAETQPHQPEVGRSSDVLELRETCEKTFNALQNQLDELRKLLEDQRKSIAATKDAIPAAVSLAAPTSGSIDQDALVALNDAIRSQSEMIRAQKEEIRSLGDESSRIATSLQEKATRTDISAIQEALSRLQGKQDELAAQTVEVGHRVEAVTKTLPNIEAKVKCLAKEKAEEVDVQRLRDSLTVLERTVQSLAAAKSTQVGTQGPALETALIEDLRSQIGLLGDAANQNNEWIKGQVIEIRAIIEHIHHSKADASLVANKAEREYVENSMEKLMREVEQVLNATNAGLIDTLDKSLNILRDMIDGKATKADVTKLQTMIGEEQVGTVPEGLTGFKGYRCLGCNRSLEGMRQRPMGGNFSSFMNRLPNNQRPSNSSQGVRVPVAPPPTAGFIGAPPGSA